MPEKSSDNLPDSKTATKEKPQSPKGTSLKLGLILGVLAFLLTFTLKKLTLWPALALGVFGLTKNIKLIKEKKRWGILGIVLSAFPIVYLLFLIVFLGYMFLPKNSSGQETITAPQITEPSHEPSNSDLKVETPGYKKKEAVDYRYDSGLDFNFSYPQSWHVYLGASDDGSNFFRMNDGPIWRFPHSISKIEGVGNIIRPDSENTVKNEFQNRVKGFLNNLDYENRRILDWNNSAFETNCYKYDYNPQSPAMFDKSQNHLKCFVIVEKIQHEKFIILYEFTFSNYYELEGKDAANIEEVFKYFIESLKSFP